MVRTIYASTPDHFLGEMMSAEASHCLGKRVIAHAWIDMNGLPSRFLVTLESDGRTAEAYLPDDAHHWHKRRSWLACLVDRLR